jgi:hypothetical protein
MSASALLKVFQDNDHPITAPFCPSSSTFSPHQGPPEGHREPLPPSPPYPTHYPLLYHQPPSPDIKSPHVHDYAPFPPPPSQVAFQYSSEYYGAFRNFNEYKTSPLTFPHEPGCALETPMHVPFAHPEETGRVPLPYEHQDLQKRSPLRLTSQAFLGDMPPENNDYYGRQLPYPRSHPRNRRYLRQSGSRQYRAPLRSFPRYQTHSTST